jgi:hypothetical protein
MSPFTVGLLWIVGPGDRDPEERSVEHDDSCVERDTLDAFRQVTNVST